MISTPAALNYSEYFQRATVNESRCGFSLVYTRIDLVGNKSHRGWFTNTRVLIVNIYSVFKAALVNIHNIGVRNVRAG
ncbi:hypothetical protein CS542_06470 [Pedobacter sp. IW39]|nr:hypothetical protein CS542_06470 [Pedobacter sp. IW39]